MHFDKLLERTIRVLNPSSQVFGTLSPEVEKAVPFKKAFRVEKACAVEGRSSVRAAFMYCHPTAARRCVTLDMCVQLRPRCHLGDAVLSIPSSTS